MKKGPCSSAAPRPAYHLSSEIEGIERERTVCRRDEVSSSDRLGQADQAINRIYTFITDFEQRLDDMRKVEQVARDRQYEIEIEESKLEAERCGCDAMVEKLQSQLFESKHKHIQLGTELAGVAYREAVVQGDLSRQPLDGLRAGYDQTRQIYEGQQDSQTQIQIAAAQAILLSKQREFSNQLEGATETEVRTVAEPLDYVEIKLREEAARRRDALDQAMQAKAARNARKETARKQYSEKRQAAPEGAKRRFPEGEARPQSSVEAYALLKQGQARHSENVARKQTYDDEARSLAEESNELQKRAAQYEGQANLLDEFREETIPPAELPSDFSEVKVAVSSARIQEKNAAAVEQRESRERSAKLKAARAVTADARFTEKKLGLAKRFESYTDEVLLAEVDQIRSDLEQRIAVNRDRLAGLKQTREQLIHMMDGLADEILSLLRKIEKVSRLPEEGMGAWSGKSFIRVSFHQPDVSERQIALLCFHMAYDVLF